MFPDTDEIRVQVYRRGKLHEKEDLPEWLVGISQGENEIVLSREDWARLIKKINGVIVGDLTIQS